MGKYQRIRHSRAPTIRRAILGSLVLAILILAACWFAFPPSGRQNSLAISRTNPGEPPRAPFVDITAAAGIEFVHENGAAGEKLLPETMGGGSAWLDFDRDGAQDLLLVNSQHWPWTPPPLDQPNLALYRNNGRGGFEDVTPGSGLDVSLYGMGAAIGDYDNDGRVDVFLSALGPNRLFRNLGGGKFEDVTASAGVAGDDEAWSTSCGFFDYDNDGDLDLFVCNYLRWSREHDLAQNFRIAGGDDVHHSRLRGDRLPLHRRQHVAHLNRQCGCLRVRMDGGNNHRPIGRSPQLHAQPLRQIAQRHLVGTSNRGNRRNRSGVDDLSLSRMRRCHDGSAKQGAQDKDAAQNHR